MTFEKSKTTNETINDGEPGNITEEIEIYEQKKFWKQHIK